MRPLIIDPHIRRIGILGGCFDPVHLGHLAVARLAAEHFHIERFFLVPSGTPPHKRDTRPAAQRLAMLSAAIAGHSGLEVWDGELHREGPSYTIDTLSFFRSHFPAADIYFVIGADNLREILSWRNWRDIVAMVTLCVTERPGYSMDIPQEISDAGARIVSFPSPHWGISSTLVRTYLAQGYSCEGMIDPAVFRYISENGLYSASIPKR